MLARVTRWRLTLPHVRICERVGVRLPRATRLLCHCQSEAQANRLRGVLEQRFTQCGLELHPEKTRIVYCKDDDRREHYSNEQFDFLGYTFRPRRSKNRWGKYFVNFSPGVSNAAAKAIRQSIRGWRLDCRIDKRVDDLARMFNPIIRGWINYYGRYYKVGTLPGVMLSRPALSALGDGEIQTLEAASPPGRALDSADSLP